MGVDEWELSRWLPAALVLWWMTRRFRKSILTWWWRSENGLKLNVATCTVLHLLPYDEVKPLSDVIWVGLGGGVERLVACELVVSRLRGLYRSKSSAKVSQAWTHAILSVFYYRYLEYGISRPNSRKDVQRMQIVQNAVITVLCIEYQAIGYLLDNVASNFMLVIIVKCNWNNDH